MLPISYALLFSTHATPHNLDLRTPSSWHLGGLADYMRSLLTANEYAGIGSYPKLRAKKRIDGKIVQIPPRTKVYDAQVPMEEDLNTLSEEVNL